MNNGNGWATASTFDAASYANEQMAARGTRNGAGAIVDGTVQKGNSFLSAVTGSSKFEHLEYSVVGINVSHIPVMRDKIGTYVKDIQDYLDQIDPLAEASKAFKSETVQEAVQKYITKVKDYCVNLTSQLLAFSDKLADVRDAYEQSMGNLADDINSQNSAFSEGTRYTTQKQ